MSLTKEAKCFIPCIRETDTKRFCDFCGKWICHKSWITHRNSRTHMDYESKSPNDPRIKIYNKEEELSKLNGEIKSSVSYELLTFHTSIMFEYLQKEVTKNEFVTIKSFDILKNNDSFVFNEKGTHKPFYFTFNNGQFQSLDDERNLYVYIFDLRHSNVIIYKAKRMSNPDSLTSLIQKLEVKEYVRKVYSNDDEYTDEARMRIFWKNMQNLRDKVSSNISINEIKELDFFKDYDYEKYEITNDGLERIKYLRSDDL